MKRITATFVMALSLSSCRPQIKPVSSSGAEKVRVTRNGLPVPNATVSFFKLESPVGSNTPCRALWPAQLSTATLNSERCTDLDSTLALLKEARKFLFRKPLATVETDADGLASVPPGDGIREVWVSSPEAVEMFKLLPQPGRIASLTLPTRDLNDFVDAMKTSSKKAKAWLVGLNVRWVMSVDELNAKGIPSGLFAYVEENGNRVLVENSGLAARTRGSFGPFALWEKPLEGEVLKDGKPVKDASVVAACGTSLTARTSTDSEGRFQVRPSCELLIAVKGDLCAQVRREDQGPSGQFPHPTVRMTLEKCTLASSRVLDSAGEPLAHPGISWRDGSGFWDLPGLEDGRIFFPRHLQDARIGANGFATEKVTLKDQPEIRLERSRRHTLHVRTVDGLFLRGFIVSPIATQKWDNHDWRDEEGRIEIRADIRGVRVEVFAADHRSKQVMLELDEQIVEIP